MGMSAVCRQHMRLKQILKSVCFAGEQGSIRVNPSCLISVRFRKPKFLGRAPSKEPSYFAKKHPTEKDVESNTALYRNYNAILKSLVCGFQEDLLRKQQLEATITSNEMKWDEEGHHQKCMSYNEAENEKLRTVRMERIQDEITARQKFEQTKVEEKEKEAEILKGELQKQVEKVIKESKDWITLENLEEKITEAIDNPINFNFCVDERGVIIKRTAQVL
ncbi:small ribosomal subunit protein mS26-like [Clavelina lepadiformis]|uniref:small ribosomal subunit protein mS26-like n=1 Tax=Clavelina lepadiformis TaxID=159417 RepID=UPI004041E02F